MTPAADLQFDKMDVDDTKLAQKYLRKNNNEFHGVNDVDSGAYINDAAGNKIYYSGCNSSLKLYGDMKSRFNLSILLFNLAKKIEDPFNIKLFCQLEFLIRGKSIQTTQIELNMIAMYLRYLANADTKKYFLKYKEANAIIVMKNDSPLIELGCLNHLALKPHILAAENTAAVCHLFAEICRSVGLDSLTLSFLKNAELREKSKPKVLDGGCIGVVMSESDVESAVDVFLSVPKGDLWGIRRILVEESAGERVRSAFAWRMRSGSPADVDLAYFFGGTPFLWEYVGPSRPRLFVHIEAFRTVKELLALIGGYDPFSVSLWAHGRAQADEIAHGIAAPLVWLNRHGAIAGSPHVALAYYCHRVFHAIVNHYDERKVEEIRKMQRDWIKRPPIERQNALLSVIQKLPRRERESADRYRQLVLSAESQSNSFVHVGDGELVVGVTRPRDLYALDWRAVSGNIDEIVTRLSKGSGFIIQGIADFLVPAKDFLVLCAEDGLPVKLSREELIFWGEDKLPPDTIRVVYSSFGTIFAN